MEARLNEFPPPQSDNPYSPPQAQVLADELASESATPEFAGFKPRAIARIIDTLIHFMAGVFAGVLVAIASGIYMAKTRVPMKEALSIVQPDAVARFFLGILAGTVFQTVCEWGHGSSPGKLLRGLVVLDEGLSRPSFRAVLQRNIAYLFDSLFFGAVAYAWMEKSSQKQRSGDKWAHTVVVHRHSAPPARLRSGGRFVVIFGVGFVVDALIVAAPALLAAIAA